MSKLTLAEAISAFGAEAKAKLSNPAATGQPEDQLRTPLVNLFDAFAELTGKTGHVTLVGETSLAGAQTRPDFAVTVGAGKAKALIGFIEVKAPGKGADPRKFKDPHDKAQWGKLKALPNLLYTDGEAFSLWRDGEVVSVVRLDGEIASSGAKLSAPNELLPLIEDFLSWQPLSPKNAHQLAITAARLCRFLRDEVIEQMEPEDSALRDLAKDWRGLLFPEASDEQFADGYAQAVTFGLLMAKSQKIDLDEGLADVANDLAKSSTLIGRAFDLLTKQEDLLGPSLKTLVRVLDVVDWDLIAKGNPEAWIDFYELFLSIYDNKLRKLTGSYYTPPEVVRAMVRLCDEALKSRFGKSAGLADSEVQIADPAVGSGTFLLGLLRHMADWKEADEGKGAVGPFITEAAKRLYGFELQFGPFAVAQLRLHAEMIELKAKGSPHLYVTDTLGDPNQAFERGTGIYAALSKSQEEANEVKRTQPITVVIGNPPYKEKAKGKGSWVEQGSGNSPAPLIDWQPPVKWGVGAHAKHLRNLYIYFWRWAAWKVFESGHGKDEPSGIVCFITVAGFLSGPGFQKMRADLRRECDEIWVIDCSPEGHQPEVATRVFEGVQHPICITICSRSPDNDREKPARVYHRTLCKGRREHKFEELEAISLSGQGWVDGESGWRAPFLPELAGGWAGFVPLDSVLGDCGSGVMPGRTWIIAPDMQSLERRWKRLVDEKDPDERASLFHPHEGGDRKVDKGTDGLPRHGTLASIEFGLENRDSADMEKKAAALDALMLQKPVSYAFRSFDRQTIIPDKRLINRPNPKLWENHGRKQVYLTAQMDRAPSNGPGATLCSIIPDLHQYAGRGGRVFALWEDGGAKNGNIVPAAMAAITKTYGAAPSPEDAFASTCPPKSIQHGPFLRSRRTRRRSRVSTYSNATVSRAGAAMSAAMFGAPAIRRAYVVDDDAAYRQSMELLLVSEFWAVECFATASEFADQAPLLEPGILLLDLHLDGTSGLDLLERHPAILDRFAVVMITGAGEIETAVQSMKAGAVDFIEKPMAATELLDRIEAIATDFTLSLQERRAIFDARRRIEALSPRERDVLNGLLTGASNKHIARHLEISPRTVEMHRARMVQKLGVDTTAAALEIGRMAKGS